MKDLKDNAWKGRRCFIVGGGPSLKDFDWSLLDNELWIGINGAWLKKTPTICYTHDQRIIDLFARDHHEAFSKLPCRVHKHKRQLNNNPRFQGIIGLGNCQVWSKSLEQGVYDGNNSGVSALNLAEILGADPIYLLGFDMKIQDGKNQYHDLYPKEWKTAEDMYQRFCFSFKKMLPHIKAQVINLNPDSALDYFPKMKIEEVLSRNTAL